MNLFAFLRERCREDYTCPLCQREKFDRTPFCARCEQLLSQPRPFVCPVCGRRSVSAGLCADCKAEPPAFAFCRTFSDYAPPLSSAVFRLKFRNQPFLAHPLAKKLADVWRKEGIAVDGVCFVPMGEKREKKRGYNQAALLAEAFCKDTGIPLLPCLLRKKEGQVQHTLTRSERKRNLVGCFAASPKEVKDKTLLLIDDVITTGATLDAAAAALKKAGASKVYCLTVCATPDPALKKLQRKKEQRFAHKSPFRLFKKKGDHL